MPRQQQGATRLEPPARFVGLALAHTQAHTCHVVRRPPLRPLLHARAALSAFPYCRPRRHVPAPLAPPPPARPVPAERAHVASGRWSSVGETPSLPLALTGLVVWPPAGARKRAARGETPIRLTNVDLLSPPLPGLCPRLNTGQIKARILRCCRERGPPAHSKPREVCAATPLVRLKPLPSRAQSDACRPQAEDGGLRLHGHGHERV